MSETIPYTVPGTSHVLYKAMHEFTSADGRLKFPIVAGMPVLFPLRLRPTFDAYARSQQMADPSDEWQVDTLAIEASLQQCVREQLKSGKNHLVDPAISYLILATNGMAYESSVGKLEHYPIPNLPLPAAEGASLLDIGCSWGRWTASAAGRGYNVYGIDPSLGAVLAARRMFRQLELCGNFACGDGRALPFPENAFDIVHSYSVLQHFSDDDADTTWAEIGRVLKPSGMAVVQMANALGARSIYHLIRRHFRRPKVFEVRYRLPTKLKRFGEEHVGETTLTIDCFFGLGLQNSDQHLYRRPARTAVRVSELLKQVGRAISPIKVFADSVYVRSVKRMPNWNGDVDKHG